MEKKKKQTHLNFVNIGEKNLCLMFQKFGRIAYAYYLLKMALLPEQYMYYVRL